MHKSGRGAQLDDSLTDCWRQQMKTTCYIWKGKELGLSTRRNIKVQSFLAGFCSVTHKNRESQNHQPSQTILHIPCHNIHLIQLLGLTCTCVWEWASVHEAVGTEQHANSFKRHFLTVTRCCDSLLDFPFDLTINDSHLPSGTKQHADNVQRRRSPEDHQRAMLTLIRHHYGC